MTQTQSQKSQNKTIVSDQKQEKLWHLYGKKYNLKSFLKQHPGGEKILKLTQGNLDITPMFESYHALTNIDSIKEQLAKYEVGKSEQEQLYTYNKNEFYDEIRLKVKQYFYNNNLRPGQKKIENYEEMRNKNVNQYAKLNAWWMVKFFVMFLFFVINYYYAFYDSSIPVSRGIIHGILAGFSMVSIGMICYHDASHFALFQSSGDKHDVVNKIMGAILLFPGDMWLAHHTYRHHAYTGHNELDPDVQNYKPMIRKTEKQDKSKYWKIKQALLPFQASFNLFVFPGQYYGQVLVYNIIWRFKKYVWKVAYPSQITNTPVYEGIVFAIIILGHLLRFNFWISFTYFVSGNIFYCLSILPDHDTYETQKNHDDSIKDWGITQVRNSGNFCNNIFYDLYFHLFGGINYQIEHHLFPSMNHTYLPKIAPIVIETCKKYNIPYVSHTTMKDAYSDFLKQISFVNTKE